MMWKEYGAEREGKQNGGRGAVSSHTVTFWHGTQGSLRILHLYLSFQVFMKGTFDKEREKNIFK